MSNVFITVIQIRLNIADTHPGNNVYCQFVYYLKSPYGKVKRGNNCQNTTLLLSHRQLVFISAIYRFHWIKNTLCKRAMNLGVICI